MHVVLIEDDPGLCDMGEIYLSSRDHAVQVFTAANEAAAWCEDPVNPVEAVLINLNRHGSWAGLLLACRLAKARPEARITATTGHYAGLPAHLPATVRMLPKLGLISEFYDLGDGRR